MPGRIIPLVNGEYYHIFNRGSDHRDLFLQPRDYLRFQQTFYYYHYQFSGFKHRFSNFNKSKLTPPKPVSDSKYVEIICYCLMPNHFHFLVQQLKENGISIFISQLANSYTKYFNTKYKRVGSLLQGTFKATLIENDEQLMHVSRYIHLNPFVSGLVKNLASYQWSSYLEYIHQTPLLCSIHPVLDHFSSPKKYQEFVMDQADYGQTLEVIKHQLIDQV